MIGSKLRWFWWMGRILLVACWCRGGSATNGTNSSSWRHKSNNLLVNLHSFTCLKNYLPRQILRRLNVGSTNNISFDQLISASLFNSTYKLFCTLIHVRLLTIQQTWLQFLGKQYNNMCLDCTFVKIYDR